MKDMEHTVEDVYKNVEGISAELADIRELLTHNKDTDDALFNDFENTRVAIENLDDSVCTLRRLVEQLARHLNVPVVPEADPLPPEEEDELYPAARQAIVYVGRASASYLQRRLGIGYARAARLIDMLEEKGVIGPAKGALPRRVLAEK